MLSIENIFILLQQQHQMETGMKQIFSFIVGKSKQGFDDFISKFKSNSDKSSAKQQQQILNHANDKKQKSLAQRRSELLKQLLSVQQQMMKSKTARSVSTPQTNQQSYFNNEDDKEALDRAARLMDRVNNKNRNHSTKNIKITHNLLKSGSQKNIKHINEIEASQTELKRIEQQIKRDKEKLRIIQQYGGLQKFIVANYSSLSNLKLKNPQQVIQHDKQRKRKVYPKSSFLEQIMRDEVNSKKQDLLKSYERKKLKQRQLLYARKIRQK